MNKNLLKNIIIVLFFTMFVFSIFKYKSVLNENYALLNDLNLSRDRAANLETEKQNLLQDIEKRKELEQALKANLHASNNKITSLFTENDQIKQAFDELSNEFSMLTTEKMVLEEQKEQLSRENEGLMAKLNSIEDLQMQIKQLNEQKKHDKNIYKGNKGYLIKDRLFTYPAQVRIEVAPASQEE